MCGIVCEENMCVNIKDCDLKLSVDDCRSYSFFLCCNFYLKKLEMIEFV